MQERRTFYDIARIALHRFMYYVMMLAARRYQFRSAELNVRITSGKIKWRFAAQPRWQPLIAYAERIRSDRTLAECKTSLRADLCELIPQALSVTFITLAGNKRRTERAGVYISCTFTIPGIHIAGSDAEPRVHAWISIRRLNVERPSSDQPCFRPYILQTCIMYERHI